MTVEGWLHNEFYCLIGALIEPAWSIALQPETSKVRRLWLLYIVSAPDLHTPRRFNPLLKRAVTPSGYWHPETFDNIYLIISHPFIMGELASGYDTYRCQNFQSHHCSNWVMVARTPCTTCVVSSLFYSFLPMPYIILRQVHTNCINSRPLDVMQSSCLVQLYVRRYNHLARSSLLRSSRIRGFGSS